MTGDTVYNFQKVFNFTNACDASETYEPVATFAYHALWVLQVNGSEIEPCGTIKDFFPENFCVLLK